MKYDFIVFGGTGLQGRICARDLLENGYSALLCGRNPEGIKDLMEKHRRRSGFLKVDLNERREIVKAIIKSGAKIVINCAELNFNLDIMKACMESGKSVTDLGGLQKITKEQFKLNKAFKKKGIVNITGCGSTPGIANVMASYGAKDFDSIDSISLGFAWDSNIKKFVVPYSIQSIFQEFTEAPVAFHNGRFVKEKKAKYRGKMRFREIGEQEVHGIVHSEVYTFARYFKENGIKNIHYFAGFPEHSLKIIQMLIELGFNSKKEIKINGIKIELVEFISRALKELEIPKNYKEKEDLWVKIIGVRNGKRTEKEMDCIVKTEKEWEKAGSNVNTGRTISIISQMLFNRIIKEKGVHAPEGVIPYKIFFRELAKRKMLVYEDGRRIN